MKDVLVSLPENCLEGKFVRRVKRFSVEITCGQGNLWVHCNDSGAMLGLLRKNAPVIVSPASNPARKLPYTLERIWIGGENGFWAGVNTSNPNRIFWSAFQSGLLGFAKGYTNLRMESGRGQSRLDACLSGGGMPDLWVECKSVTLVEDGSAAFPDAPSERAKKHLRELMDIVRKGGRGAMFYLVQRPDAQCFGPADFIDADYASLFYEAMHAGVEVYAHSMELTDKGSGLGRQLPLRNCGG